MVLGNDREREKKRSGLEARKKKLCYAHRIINCREKGQSFKKRKKKEEEEKRYNKWKNNDMAKSKGKSGKKEK